MCNMFGLPGGSDGKETSCNVGDLGSIPGLERSPGEGIVYSLQYSWAPLVVQKVRESACNVGDLGSVPGLERSSGEENGYPLQYSCLENFMDRGTWWVIVCGVTKSHTTE